MRIIADLHIHSKYSRAVSPKMDIDHICEWAKIKGIDVVGTGDFTHYKWIAEIKEKLVEDGTGLLRLKNEKNNVILNGSEGSMIGSLPMTGVQSPNSDNIMKDCHADARNDSIRFILTSEIACIYKQGPIGSKCRKIHLIIFAPSISTVDKINVELNKIGNIHSDGRPILGISAYNLAKLIFSVDERCMVIPAHAWTPWFSIFGSKSGFDTIEDCFGDLTPKIYAIETGLSSDPEMNWRLSKLDNITLISNSDAHSLPNLGREANVFEIDSDKITYNEICDIIKTKDKKRFPYTIEFYPEEGKYHFDGHAACNLCIDPFKDVILSGSEGSVMKDCRVAEAPRNDKEKIVILSGSEGSIINSSINRCPVCRRPMTIGVASQVQKLADRQTSIQKKSFPSTVHLVPLREIIAGAYGVGVQSKKVNKLYFELVEKFGSEFHILLDLDEKYLHKNFPERIAQGIINVKNGDIKIEPGYDGIYGKVHIFG